MSDKAANMAVANSTNSTDFIDRNFILSKSFRSGLSLLQLPDESRIKVLPNIFKAPYTIDTLGTCKREAPHRKKQCLSQTCLSAQVLRCCQKLYLEGIDIL